jgi:hypothetical protein
MYEEHLTRALRHGAVDVLTEPSERALFALVSVKVYPVAGDAIRRLICRTRKDPGGYDVRHYRRRRLQGRGDLRVKSIPYAPADVSAGGIDETYLDSITGERHLLHAVRIQFARASQAVDSIGTNRTPKRFITV